MSSETNYIVVGTALVGLLVGLAGCVCPPAQVSFDGDLAIIKEPQSQMAEVGSTVTFSVQAIRIGPPSTNALTYQWLSNSIVIPNATNSSLVLSNVQFASAGQYSVIVFGSQVLSTPATLTVYRLTGPRSSPGNAGSLSVGVSSFLNGNNNQACFPSSQGWDRYFVITNCYFCGSSVRLQCFTNSTGAANCTLSTCDSANANGTLATGIVIYYEFNPNDKVCATNAPQCTLTPTTPLTTCTRQMAANDRYRATIFYKSSTIGSLTHVVADWSYQ